MKRIQRICLPLILFTGLIFLLTGCDDKRIFEENKDIPDNNWNVNNKVKLNVSIKDISTAANFYVNVRNADGYPYSNLFLFIKTTFPNGKFSTDTLECVLADERGKWLGKGLGDIYDNQIPFKRNVRFPLPGVYTFEIQHGMRTETVPLIMDIGLRIEKAE
ncbi:MAG TPA: gliding motility lipoprotein GldH [Bacteroidia bacterium]|jgi:gliding motility-associated lipoprotein GldH|nr:gliding motility lipoprotein GldH [Bacteroidia bacterium]